MEGRHRNVGGGLCVGRCELSIDTFGVIQTSLSRQQSSHLCANEETVTLNWRERMLMNVLLGFKEKILPSAVEN